MAKTNLNFVFENIGRTRSDKIVIAAAEREDVEEVMDYLNKIVRFTADDLLDAYAMFNYLALRAQRKKMSSDIFVDHANVGKFRI